MDRRSHQCVQHARQHGRPVGRCCSHLGQHPRRRDVVITRSGDGSTAAIQGRAALGPGGQSVGVPMAQSAAGKDFHGRLGGLLHRLHDRLRDAAGQLHRLSQCQTARDSRAPLGDGRPSL